jgi:hypothetical protein
MANISKHQTKLGRGNFMRVNKLCVLTIMLAGLFISSITFAAPFYAIPSLQSITFWESTSIIPTPNTFDIHSVQLLTRLEGNLTNGSYDFWGVPSLELYDVFYSNADGTFNKSGQYVTIEAQFPSWAAGGGLNICEMQLNFPGRIDHANYVASYVALGVNAISSSVANAIDGDLQTWTTLGNTFEQSERLRLTLGYISPNTPAVPVPPTLIMLGSGILGLLGFRNRIRRV